MTSLRIGLAQFHPVMGQFEVNLASIGQLVQEAKSQGCDIVCFGELAISGYPPQDLLFNTLFVERSIEATNRLTEVASGIVVVIGGVSFGEEDKAIHNSAYAFGNNNLLGISHKSKLPNYEVFDEKRYFTPGPACVIDIKGHKAGLIVCEDVWDGDEVCQSLSDQGAELLVVVNASPYSLDKSKERSEVLDKRMAEVDLGIAYVNIVGGQDGLVFDGSSHARGPQFEMISDVGQFEEGLAVWDWNAEPTQTKPNSPVGLPQNEAIFAASVRGLRDYVNDNGFDQVGVALSGGIDSALTTYIAAKALGGENVHAVTMPSVYSSDHSISDSVELCNTLGIEIHELGIETIHSQYQQALSESLDASIRPITDENLQSRIRGVLMMALSNQQDWLVLATGNKTEAAVGYSTLYGDTVGAYGVIRDLWKDQVYELSNWINGNFEEQIPDHIISKPPSAELRPDQTDEETLGNYDTVDAILKLYIEQRQTVTEIASQGYDLDHVKRMVGLVDRAEYKRRQSPIGTRISKMSFGVDRRVPITNSFKPL